MRQKLEGKKVAELPEEYWDYKMVRAFGWSKPQIDESPGHWTDWMLAINEVERAVARAGQPR